MARLRAVMSRSTTTRDLNPLTGMSGNSDILREMGRRLASEERFACLYPDIDSFKSYNDHYGFLRGDDVIKTLATIILEVLEENYSSRHFAGHVGGDDFVILTDPDLVETIASAVTQRFDDAMPALYDPVDGITAGSSRGGVRNRLRTQWSVSIGIVIPNRADYSSPGTLVAGGLGEWSVHADGSPNGCSIAAGRRSVLVMTRHVRFIMDGISNECYSLRPKPVTSPRL